TVVPAPAVTVPVITTGNAVVLCPPATQMICPVAALDGTAVVRSVGVISATTLRPGTTVTTWVPRIVTMVLSTLAETTETVPEITVVPAPALTVPVTTTGNAVVLWPPAIQIT